MTPLWHDGPLKAIAPGEGPLVWSLALQTDAGLALHADDLRDAAAVRDGAARLARRLLARALVARLAGCAGEAVTIARDGFGAPRVIAPAGWYLSLSGRDDHVLIGVARVPIGVDREPLEAADIAWDMLAPGEAAALHALPAAQRATAWLTRWTLKEAHAKLVGEPRRIRPEAVVTVIGADGRGETAFEGVSETWTRVTPAAVESVAMWRTDRSPAKAGVPVVNGSGS